jgi:hypothetical protein
LNPPQTGPNIRSTPTYQSGGAFGSPQLTGGPVMRSMGCCAAMIVFGAVLASAEFSVGEPQRVTEVDAGKLKGMPAALTWSPNEGEYYLQTVQDRTIRHYTIRIGAEPQQIPAEPEWATSYWNWKSSRNVPGHLDMLISVETKNEKASIPNESLSEKAAGMSSGTVAMRGAATEAIAGENGTQTRTLMLNGEAIGEFKNQPLVPGQTFGWSPESLHAVAYVTHNKQLSLLDVISKDTHLIASSKDVSLPAWSLDGKAIVYLEKSGRQKYTLMRVDVH